MSPRIIRVSARKLVETVKSGGWEAYRGECKWLLSEPLAPLLLASMGYREAYCYDLEHSIRLYDRYGLRSTILRGKRGDKLLVERAPALPAHQAIVFFDPSEARESLIAWGDGLPTLVADPSTILVADEVYELRSHSSARRTGLRIRDNPVLARDVYRPRLLLPRFLTASIIRVRGDAELDAPWLCVDTVPWWYCGLCAEEVCRFSITEGKVQGEGRIIVFRTVRPPRAWLWTSWFQLNIYREGVEPVWLPLIVRGRVLVAYVGGGEGHLTVLLASPAASSQVVEVVAVCKRVVSARFYSLGGSWEDATPSYDRVKLVMAPGSVVLLELELRRLPPLVKCTPPRATLPSQG